MNNERQSNEKDTLRFLTETDRRLLSDVGRWVADEGPRDLWLLVDTIVGQHLARVIPPVRTTCFICGQNRAEGSEWCVDHTDIPPGEPS